MIGVRTVLFTIFVPGTVTVLFPYLLLRSELPQLRFSPGGLRFAGLVAIAAGVALYARCAWVFTTAGRGTPAPFDPPRKLVTSGPYRLVRNPIYVAVPLVLIGEAWWLGVGALFLYAVVLFVGFHLRVVWYEEPALRRAFGEEFDCYSRSVPRWVPRLGAKEENA